jgi:tripartite-type tricarboxylate transporter receptor subunit TctC
MNRRTLIAFLASAHAWTLASPLRAQQAWPTQPIRWIIPYPAGGGTDVLARALSESMRETLGQPLIIDNRPGASTNIGAELTARAKPDGYTIMSGDNAAMFFNEFLFSKLAYKPDSDFTYIGAIGRFPMTLVVHPDFAARSVSDLLTLAKKDAGKINYASPGNGSPHHLAMELFKNRTGTDFTHVPYRGAAPAMQDVMGGQVPCMFLDLASGLPNIQANKFRVLAIGSPNRSPLLPDVPTLAEAGVKDSEVFAFQGLLGPANMPAEVVAKLNGALNKALGSEAVVKRFTDFGLEIQPGTGAAFKQVARSEAKRWGPIIQGAGIRLD